MFLKKVMHLYQDIPECIDLCYMSGPNPSHTLPHKSNCWNPHTAFLLSENATLQDLNHCRLRHVSQKQVVSFFLNHGGYKHNISSIKSQGSWYPIKRFMVPAQGGVGVGFYRGKLLISKKRTRYVELFLCVFWSLLRHMVA